MDRHSKRGQRNKPDYSPKNQQKPLIEGIISTTGRGLGFVAHPDGKSEDILIEQGFLNTALNGDGVEVRLNPPQAGERQTGEVTKVLKRTKTTFVGTIEEENGKTFLIPDNRKMYVDILVTDTTEKIGTKAQAEITGWDKNLGNPIGKITKVLGQKGDHETEMQAIVLERGIDTHFPPEVEEEARGIKARATEIMKEEIAKRKDLRQTLTLTIDPVDAKDFDDAISFKPLGENLFEIGVHIADVSQFVREKTEMDKEARKRAFSTYLVDRTIPMLPEILSNDLCSLNPNEDKLAFSAVFNLDQRGQVKSRWFGKSVIHSNKRFTYENAQAAILDKSAEYHEELSILNSIAKTMREENKKSGAIDFGDDEVKFELDKTGKPIRVYKKERLDTHKLVEQYMLLANREVAEFIHKAETKAGGKMSSLYRIHDVPDPEKIAELSIFLKALGHELPHKNGNVSAKDINALLAKIEGRAEEALVRTAALRSMAKAIYSTSNIGHFGLAFEYYTHFTSPIRRYADLIIHRVLENILSGNPKQAADELNTLSKIAAYSSDREIEIADAERASIKYKQVEYMMDKVGETFDATISGVSEWGIYVQEEKSRAEGMIRLGNIGGDYFETNPKTYSVTGQKTKKKFSLGDKVKVKLTSANLDERTLDFAFI